MRLAGGRPRIFRKAIFLETSGGGEGEVTEAGHGDAFVMIGETGEKFG